MNTSRATTGIPTPRPTTSSAKPWAKRCSDCSAPSSSPLAPLIGRRMKRCFDPFVNPVAGPNPAELAVSPGPLCPDRPHWKGAPPEAFHQTMHEHQPKPHTVFLVGFTRALTKHVQALQLQRRHATPGVGHRELETGPIAPDPQVHECAGPREVQRVVDQFLNHGGQIHRIRPQAGPGQ